MAQTMLDHAKSGSDLAETDLIYILLDHAKYGSDLADRQVY